MGYRILPLSPEHASAVAALHAEGQPQTFLTRLGPAFLRALYAQMAASPHALGYVAVDGEEVVGVVTGTTDASAVFRDLLLRRGLRLAWPVAKAILGQPALLAQVVQTLFYPAKTPAEPGEAELFFIGTRAPRRGEGIGGALFAALVEALRRRGMRAMGLLVDESNEVAKAFYRHRGMRAVRSFTLYGRPMSWYRLALREGSDEHSDAG